MPLYDFCCDEDSRIFEKYVLYEERDSVTCECGSHATLTFQGKSPGLSLFEAGFFEHVSLDGEYCRTPEQLRDACERNNSRSVYLENSGVFRSERPRWV